MEDCEMADIIVINKERIKGQNEIFYGVNGNKHPIIEARQNCVQSRTIITKHLRNEIFVSFIKEMYEEVTEYFKYILLEGASNGANVNRLIGENKVNLKANDILSQKSQRDTKKFIMDIIFQQLENERSTVELIKKVDAKLGLKIKDSLIDEAMPYLLIRHIFVHSDGKPNSEFKQKYPNFKLNQKSRIDLNLDMVKMAYSKVESLLKDFDEKMIKANYIGRSEIVV